MIALVAWRTRESSLQSVTFVAGYFVIFSACSSGVPDAGRLRTLQTQPVRDDSYLFGFAVISVGMIAAGFNLAATIINYAAA